MEVQIPCICPPTEGGERRHATDSVTLPDVLDFRRTLVLRKVATLAATQPLAETLAALTEGYLLYCIDGWTVVDARDQPVPVTQQNVETYLIANIDAAFVVGDAADDLYFEKVLLPLVKGGQTSSPPSRMVPSTSATTGAGPTSRKPSRRSSTSTSQMDVTGPMAASPGGVSSSSPS